MALSYVVKLGPIISGDRSYQKDEEYDGSDIEELLALGRITAIDVPLNTASPVVEIETLLAPDLETEEESDPIDLSGLNAMDAKRAIDACDDIQQLQSWMGVDTRSHIRKAINDRLTALNGAK